MAYEKSKPQWIIDTEVRWEKPWVKEENARLSLTRGGHGASKLLASTPLHTQFGNWTYLIFGDYTTGALHSALVYGDYKNGSLGDGKNVLVRVHSKCETSELFHATNCECREELDKAMRQIRRKGRGVLVYLDQEGAGYGLAAKVKAYNMVFEWNKGRITERKDKSGKPLSVYKAYLKMGLKNEGRSFMIAAEMLKSIGVNSVLLMTNNPNKVKGLEDEGIPTKPMGIHIKPKTEEMRHHLRAKAKELGHKIRERNI